jgi:phospholipase C
VLADDPIKHVVVLMLENRSFDQVLGGLTAATSKRVGSILDWAQLKKSSA